MKKIIGSVVSGLLVLAGFITVSPAFADTLCEPQDAWTEIVQHEPVGEPTLTIDNPDYQPGTDGYYETADKLWKWTWVGGPVGSTPASPLVDSSGWNEVGWSNDSKGRANPDQVIQTGPPGKANYFYFQTIITWVEGTPAIGEPTLTIDNPDYVPGWSEEIEHSAVVCPIDIPEKPETITGDEQETTDPVCVIPADGTEVSYLKNRIWTQDWELIDNEWAVQKREYQPWEIADTIISVNSECDAVVVTPPVVIDIPQSIPTVQHSTTIDSEALPNTGADSYSGLWSGVALLVLGSVMGLITFIRRRVNG